MEETTFMKASSLMSAPMQTLRSSTGPTFTFGSSCSSRAFSRFHSVAGTYSREAAEHFCP
jgi:hypothetical protein